jgi:dienelactone hydrolase
MNQVTQITDYQTESFSFPMRNGHTATHDVYSRGNGKKVLILIQELPGIGQETLALADRFVDREYTVVLPHLFGPIGKTSMIGNTIRVFCMRRAFRLFARTESSPIVDFLSGLCSAMKERHGVKGVAVIGMCLTGNFAISLMANEDVLAGFASQPAMPLLQQSALHMSQDTVKEIKHNLDQVGPMHCGRFRKDPLCTSAKFHALDQMFNRDGRERIIFHELPGRGHSILTLDFVDEEGHPTFQALQEVMGYFDGQLG